MPLSMWSDTLIWYLISSFHIALSICQRSVLFLFLNPFSCHLGCCVNAGGWRICRVLLSGRTNTASWFSSYPLYFIPLCLSLAHRHSDTHTHTLAWDQVHVWGGSLLSLLGPQLPPALQMATVSAPHLLHTWETPYILHPHPPTAPAPSNKVRHYK